MSKSRDKENQKKHYLKVIAEKEPVRPSELEFRRVRYDWLDELEAEDKIYKKEIGKQYVGFPNEWFSFIRFSSDHALCNYFFEDIVNCIL